MERDDSFDDIFPSFEIALSRITSRDRARESERERERARESERERERARSLSMTSLPLSRWLCLASEMNDRDLSLSDMTEICLYLIWQRDERKMT